MGGGGVTGLCHFLVLMVLRLRRLWQMTQRFSGDDVDGGDAVAQAVSRDKCLKPLRSLGFFFLETLHGYLFFKSYILWGEKCKFKNCSSHEMGIFKKKNKKPLYLQPTVFNLIKADSITQKLAIV